MSRTLTSKSTLETLKKDAKRWLKALRSSAPQSRSAGLPHAALPGAISGANALKRSASQLGNQSEPSVRHVRQTKT